MMNPRMFYQGACLALLLCTADVGAVSIYKYRMADGGTMYTEKPIPKTRLIAVLQAHDPVPASLSLQKLERDKREEQRLYAEVMEERRFEALMAAQQAARHQNWSAHYHGGQFALTPRPGERTGTASGYSRLNDHYWQRYAGNQDYAKCGVIYRD